MGYSKQHRVAGDTVITESKQNIPWKGNCLIFIPESFVLPSVYKNFCRSKGKKCHSKRNDLFSNLLQRNGMGYCKQHRVAGHTVITESK